MAGLWFAWKLVLLQYRKQLAIFLNQIFRRCDLLENSYFCSIANNLPRIGSLHVGVVICLKTRTFAVSQTTLQEKLLSFFLLWFAWKLVLLQYRKQPSTVEEFIIQGCDLLENSYFCSIANNIGQWQYSSNWVVICLKTRTFAVSQTTHRIGTKHRGSCDLLENSYFCSIANNYTSIHRVL